MPPYTARVRNGVNRPRRRASDSIWTTSSRVGAMTSMRGAPTPAGVDGAGERRRRVNPAMRNAAVLPVPVCDCPATSLPRSASGSAASWIGGAGGQPPEGSEGGEGGGQLEHGAERGVELEEEVGRVLRGDHRREPRPRVAQEERERVGRHDEERNPPPADEEERPDEHERQRVLLLVRVEPGCDERPDLPEDPRRRDE